MATKKKNNLKDGKKGKKKITKQDILDLEYEEKKTQVSMLKGLEAVTNIAMAMMISELEGPKKKTKKKKVKKKAKKKKA